MTTNKDYCLQSIDHCKRFQPIAEKYGVGPDGYWEICEGNFPGGRDSFFYPAMRGAVPLPSDITVELVKTWRQDKLELPLPEWYESEGIYYFRDAELSERIRYRAMLKDIVTNVGEPKRQAKAIIKILEERQ